MFFCVKSLVAISADFVIKLTAWFWMHIDEVILENALVM